MCFGVSWQPYLVLNINYIYEKKRDFEIERIQTLMRFEFDRDLCIILYRILELDLYKEDKYIEIMLSLMEIHKDNILSYVQILWRFN